MFVLVHCSNSYSYPLATSSNKDLLKKHSMSMGMFLSSHDENLLLPYDEAKNPDSIAEHWHYIYSVKSL